MRLLFLFFLFNSQIQHQNCNLFYLRYFYVSGTWVSWYGFEWYPSPMYTWIPDLIHSFLFHSALHCTVFFFCCFFLRAYPSCHRGGGKGSSHPCDRLPVHRKTFLIRCNIDLFLATLPRQAVDRKNHIGEHSHASHVVQVAKHGSSNL